MTTENIEMLNCYFCNSEMINSGLAKGYLYSACEKCPHLCSTHTNKRNKLISRATIHFEYKEVYYRCQFYPQNKQFRLIRVGKLNTDYTIIAREIMSLPFIPDNITPHNILTKISTLLVFS